MCDHPVRLRVATTEIQNHSDHKGRARDGGENRCGRNSLEGEFTVDGHSDRTKGIELRQATDSSHDLRAFNRRMFITFSCTYRSAVALPSHIVLACQTTVRQTNVKYSYLITVSENRWHVTNTAWWAQSTRRSTERQTVLSL